MTKMSAVERITNEPDLLYEILVTIIAVLGLMADIMIISTISTKDLLRTKANIYIVNFCAADLLNLIVLLIYYLDKRLLGLMLNSSQFQCFLANLELTLQVICVLFVIIIVTNLLYKSRCVSQISLALIAWNILLVGVYFNSQMCGPYNHLLQGIIYGVIMLTLFLIIITKYCLRCKGKGDKSKCATYRLNIGTIFLSLCLLSWLVNLIVEFSSDGPSMMSYIIRALGTSVKLGKNLALLFYLYTASALFRSWFLRIYCCGERKIYEANTSVEHVSIDMSIRMPSGNSSSLEEKE